MGRVARGGPRFDARRAPILGGKQELPGRAWRHRVLCRTKQIMPATASLWNRAHELGRGAPGAAQPWIGARGLYGIAEPMLLILAAGGFYGASIGAWRGAELALYGAIKLPLLLFGTLLVNALLNGLWARRFGL